jgi:hypothetical protein
MNKIVVSASMVALGAVGLQAAGYAPGYSSTDGSKPWSVGLTLSGFYDSNPFTYNWNNPYKISSWGYEISPYLSGAYSTDQTQFGARYTFAMDYYENYPNNNAQISQLLNFFVNHRFSQRYSLTLNDNFTYSSDPAVTQTIGGIQYPYRTQQDNLANSGTINFNAQLTELVSVVLGYANNYINYKETPDDLKDPVNNPNGVGSLAALLNRVENFLSANLQYQVSAQTMGLVGFQYGYIGYTGDGPIATAPDGTLVMSDSRNSNNYYMYVGGSHTFNPDLSVSLKAGAVYADSFNAPGGSYANWAPYVDMSLNYQYSTSGSAQLGFTQTFAQTYVLAANSSSSQVYVNVGYDLTTKLRGSVLGRMNYNKFNAPSGTGLDGENYYNWMFGVNLTYSISRHLSADVGYNFDYLDASAAQKAGMWDYNRSRVYLGITAKY